MRPRSQAQKSAKVIEFTPRSPSLGWDRRQVEPQGTPRGARARVVGLLISIAVFGIAAAVAWAMRRVTP